jgi:hypothetical protein
MPLYSPVEWSVRPTWIRGCAKGNLFAMLSCYFDASRDSPTTVTIVSGWVATVGAWDRFDGDWKILLAQYDIPYFHMKEFAHSRGPFTTWKGEENKRANFLRKAVDVIAANVLRGFACVVEHEPFGKIDKQYRLSEAVGVPYSLAGRDCVAHANLWLRKEQRRLAVKYFFEDGDEGKGELRRVMKKDGLPRPVFAPSRDTPSGDVGLTPLQAADFAAYELLKAYKAGEDLPLYKYRRSVKELAKIQASWGKYTEQNLVDLCKRVPIQPRD